MALSITLTQTDIGIPMADTYARIVMWRGDKDQTLIQVAHYANADARQANAQPVANRTVFAPTDECEGMAAMYAWLKTQPDYASAEDC
jgi:hypothetical protein